MAVNRPGDRRPSRREIAAEATRQEILAAARRLFVERGYLQTSMADIAAEAGVAIPTIYASVGPKPALVQALAVGIEFGAEVPEARARAARETDPVALLRLGPRVSRLLAEDFGDIIAALYEAAAVEPEIAGPVEAGRQMHATGSRLIAERLGVLGALRQGVTADEAAVVIALLSDMATFARLVGEHGWTYDRAEAWVSDSLARILLPGA